MELFLTRTEYKEACTIGDIYLNGNFICHTLEDKVREPKGQSPASEVSKWKVQGQTAIPRGRYEVRLSMSKRFGRVLPELLDVPGFQGIRIHTGNTDKDTEGCILVGLAWKEDAIYFSKVALAKLQPLISGETWITIT